LCFINSVDEEKLKYEKLLKEKELEIEKLKSASASAPTNIDKSRELELQKQILELQAKQQLELSQSQKPNISPELFESYKLQHSQTLSEIEKVKTMLLELQTQIKLRRR